ncbi:hypothetical protein L0U85_04110 [Glycomyces sp. L485]|uniref:hypothetical protein n=1 Tax=Glycomyces sp. L485 TaxID=2909235 RepID=UPI001F4B8990|nr:hypothetical protein [Glycomyces sp. L485]MCH7230046.1 hypothetical protein [Glycomyces sp. L485]
MTVLLTQRSQRLGVRLFTRAARDFRWWVIAGFPVTFAISLVFADVIEIGAWRITASVFQWFVAIWSGLTVHTFFQAGLAMGLTRREATVSLSVFGALLSAAAIAVVAVGLLAEHALLSAVAGPHFTLGETAATASRYLLVTPLYCCAGLALGAVEVRWRGGNAKAMPLLVASGVLALACMAFEYGQWWFPQWAPAGVGLAAALAAVFVLLLRDAPVQPKRA